MCYHSCLSFFTISCTFVQTLLRYPLQRVFVPPVSFVFRFETSLFFHSITIYDPRRVRRETVLPHLACVNILPAVDSVRWPVLPYLFVAFHEKEDRNRIGRRSSAISLSRSSTRDRGRLRRRCRLPCPSRFTAVYIIRKQINTLLWSLVLDRAFLHVLAPVPR